MIVRRSPETGCCWWTSSAHALLSLGFQRQRYVNSHLVTIEVGALYAAQNQRVQLDSFTFDQYRFKCPDTQTVQSRCTVQRTGVFADNFVKDIPKRQLLHAQPRFDGGGKATQFQLP